MNVFMRRFWSFVSVAVLLAGCMMCATMCVYIYPGGDVFAGTSWGSDEVPLGPMDVERLEISFNENGSVAISADEMVVGGHYDYYNNAATAVLSGTKITVGSREVTFIEADFTNDDLVFLLWRVEDILYPFTTPLHRVR